MNGLQPLLCYRFKRKLLVECEPEDSCFLPLVLLSSEEAELANLFLLCSAEGA